MKLAPKLIVLAIWRTLSRENKIFGGRTNVGHELVVAEGGALWLEDALAKQQRLFQHGLGLARVSRAQQRVAEHDQRLGALLRNAQHLGVVVARGHGDVALPKNNSKLSSAPRSFRRFTHQRHHVRVELAVIQQLDLLGEARHLESAEKGPKYQAERRLRVGM